MGAIIINCEWIHSLVEEGEQVTHHHQRRPRDAQQDLADALRSLVHVLDSCGKKCTIRTKRRRTDRQTDNLPASAAAERLSFRKTKRQLRATKTKKLRRKVSVWAEESVLSATASDEVRLNNFSVRKLNIQ